MGARKDKLVRKLSQEIRNCIDCIYRTTGVCDPNLKDKIYKLCKHQPQVKSKREEKRKWE